MVSQSVRTLLVALSVVAALPLCRAQLPDYLFFEPNQNVVIFELSSVGTERTTCSSTVSNMGYDATHFLFPLSLLFV